MRRPFEILRYRWWAFSLSILIIVLGIVFYFVFGGFNTGLDFGSGYSLRFELDPVGLELSYSGPGEVVLSKSGTLLTVQKRLSGTIERSELRLDSYSDMESLAKRLEDDGIDVISYDSALKPSEMVSGYNWPLTLSSEIKSINFFSGDYASIDDLRDIFGSSVQIQKLGRGYQVRSIVDDSTSQDAIQNEFLSILRENFGSSFVVLGSDFVGPRFSYSLFRSSIYAIAIAIVLILIYISVRFRPSYAISSVIALFHDVLCMLSFIVVLRLEVNATTIAAILTIIGYSLNNTIVIFDRIRDTIKEQKDKRKKDSVDWIINDSVRRSFTRTLITTITTLVAIIPLSIFATGEIRLFAINLLWGLIIGAYSSNFIAPALLYLFNKVMPIDKFKEKKEEKDLLMES